MKVRSDIVKVYKDVHIWVGILSGLMLFVAFYAGALTVFEQPLERWAAPPSALPAPGPLEQAPELMAAVLAAHPQAARNLIVMVTPTPEQPARVLWRERGRSRGDFTEYGAGFDAQGTLQVEQIRRSPVAHLVDTLHQRVGLPFPDAVARPVMGVVALLYALALASGLIVLLPTLAKDVFALRIGKNIKRLWLDVHNALGLFSLPLHVVMALTSVVFAFHDQFYEVQGQVVYPHGIQWERQAHAAPAAGAQPLAPHVLVQRVGGQAPGFAVQSFAFTIEHGQWQGHVQGLDPRYGTRARTYAAAGIDPYSGQVELDELPGQMDGWNTALTTFFMLHFGSFGGLPVRWGYLLMGLGGALLFYTGNLLWLESRRRKQRGADAVAQTRAARVLGGLTVGVCLGCVAGISATLAAARWLPAHVTDLSAWHWGLYYGLFVLALAWALVRGTARGAVELLWLCALATLAIPLSSLAAVLGVGGAWRHPQASPVIDLVALAAVPVFVLVARRTRRRMRHGPADSVWGAAPAG